MCYNAEYHNNIKYKYKLRDSEHIPALSTFNDGPRPNIFIDSVTHKYLFKYLLLILN